MEINKHGGDIYSFKDKKGGFPLDFSANVNPLGLPAAVKKEIRKSFRDFTFYPDINCDALCEEIARFEGVNRANILCGNGADDLIFRFAYAIKPRRALLISPTFTEYEAALRNVGCEIFYYDLNRDDQFTIREDILGMIPAMDILFICNPNNPTGQLTSRNMLIKIAEVCRTENCILVIDECFGDFLEHQDDFTMKNEITGFDNLVVLKAFTKIYAFAGIRLGYCFCANRELMKKFFSASQPWSVSVVAQLSGVVALKDKNYLMRTRKNTVKERRFLKENLKSLGIEVFDSYANFLMLYLENHSQNDLPYNSDGNSIYDKLLEKGILIRRCDNFRGLDSGYFRIAVKNRKDNVKFIKAFKKVLEK